MATPPRRWLEHALFACVLTLAQEAAADGDTSQTPEPPPPPAKAPSPAEGEGTAWNPYSTSIYSEGQGIPVGQRQSLHVGGTVETGYDSNVLYLPSHPVDSPLVRVRARVNLATRPPSDAGEETRAADPILAYRLPLELEYREYLGSNPSVQGLRSLNLTADPAIALFPSRPFTIFLADTFVRTSDPRNAETFKISGRDFNRVSLLGRACFGGGRLELGLGGSFHAGVWESADMQFANDLGVEGQAFARWHFRAALSASLLLRGGYLHHGNLAVIDSRPLRAVLTVSDDLAPWLSVSAGAGYGSSFAVTGPSYSGPLATVSAQLRTPWGGAAEARYERDFFDSLFARFYADDRFSLAFGQPFARDFAARVEGGVRLRRYEDLLDPSVLHVLGYSTPRRDDQIYDGRLELSYRPRQWVSFAMTYNVQADNTVFELLTASGPVPAAYVKHSTFFRMEVGL
jgi:hypothetical protein